MDAYVVHVGDDLPPFYGRICNQDSDAWVDISVATTIVTAKLRLKGTATVLQTIVCTKPNGGSDGVFLLTWPATAFDVDAGRYEVEVSVAFNGSIQTINKHYFKISPDDDASELQLKVVDDF